MVQYFQLTEILKLAFILTPDIVKDYLVTESSPLAHKVLIELLCSAKHVSFVKMIDLAVTTAKPKDEHELFKSLRDVFKSGSLEAKIKLLDLTDFSYLKSEWLNESN